MLHRRVFGEIERKALLHAIEQCRDACIDASRKAPVRGDVYEVAEKLVAAIDDVAEVLTGDRRHFWLKLHSNSTMASPGTIEFTKAPLNKAR